MSRIAPRASNVALPARRWLNVIRRASRSFQLNQYTVSQAYGISRGILGIPRRAVRRISPRRHFRRCCRRRVPVAIARQAAGQSPKAAWAVIEPWSGLRSSACGVLYLIVAEADERGRRLKLSASPLILSWRAVLAVQRRGAKAANENAAGLSAL